MSVFDKNLLSAQEKQEIIADIRSGDSHRREKAYRLLSNKLYANSKKRINRELGDDFRRKFFDIDHKGHVYYEYHDHIINDSLMALEKSILHREILDIESYYFIILSNKTKDFIEKTLNYLKETNDMAFPESNSPYVRTVSAEEICFEKAMEAIGERCRQLFNLFYYDELKLTAIADIIGLKHGTVKNEITECRKKFKDYLDNCLGNGK